MITCRWWRLIDRRVLRESRSPLVTAEFNVPSVRCIICVPVHQFTRAIFFLPFPRPSASRRHGRDAHPAEFLGFRLIARRRRERAEIYAPRARIPRAAGMRSASGAHLVGNYATFPAAHARRRARNEHRLRLHISRAGPKFRKLRAAPSAVPARPIFHAPDSLASLPPPFNPALSSCFYFPHSTLHSFFLPTARSAPEIHGMYIAILFKFISADFIPPPPPPFSDAAELYRASLSLSRSHSTGARARNTEPTTSLGPGRSGERPPGGIWRIIKSAGNLSKGENAPSYITRL